MKTIASLALLIFGFGSSAPAQEITATLSGTVTDSSGAVIPDASVTAVRQETGTTRQTTTSSSGVFFFNSLPIGTYSVTVEKGGFKKYERGNIALHVNDKVDLPVNLTVGEITEKVVISGGAPLLQTESAELSTLVGSRQINDLPLNGRNFNQLVDLVPGVAPDNGRVSGGVGLNSDTAVSVSGAQSNSNLYLVDGEYNVDSGGNGNLLVTPSVDSIEEFKILRNTYSAEFGSATGGVINVVTKSGGQDFHGTVYDFIRNDKFDATDTFLNANGQSKSKLRQNDYGFSFGGPVFIPKIFNKNRTSDFFFVSVEWRHETRGNVVQDFVPTLRQRQGILDPNCSVVPDNNAGSGCVIQPFDPYEFVLPGEVNIPQSQIDPNAIAFLNRYPLPNAIVCPTPNCANPNGFNYINSNDRVSTDNTQLYRWDHNFGSKYIFTARYIGMTQGKAATGCDIFGYCSDFPALNSDWTWKGKNVILKLTAQLTPRLLNDLQFGYSNNQLTQVPGATSDPCLIAFAKSGCPAGDAFTFTPLFPNGTTASYPALNQGSTVDSFAPLGLSAPWGNRTDNFQYKDDLAYTFGKHNLKFGGFMRFNRKKEPANGFGNDLAGSFQVANFQSLLLGQFSNFTQEQTLNNVYDRERDYALYLQDTWKVTQHLTLDLGLRYQILAQIFSATNNISNFYPSLYNSTACPLSAFDQTSGNVDPTQCSLTNGLVVPGKNGASRSTLPTHYGDFEPRLGIAWQPGFAKNLVIRTGFGIFAGRDALSQTSSLGSQLPNDIVANVSNSSFSQLGQFNVNTPQPPARLFALAPPYDSPVTYQYNLGIQYQFASNTMLDVSYVGNHGIHLGQNRNINQVPDKYRLGVLTAANNGVFDPVNNPGGCVPDGITCIPFPDMVRPYLGYNAINYNERAGTSRYNSLQVAVDHRISHGLQIQASYTYSRNITTTANQDTEAAYQPVQNAYNLAAEKGLASQDTPNSLSINYIWELPFFSQSHGFVRQALHGWKVVGISTFRSGLPTNVCLSQDVAGTGTSGYECQRPDQVGNPNLPKGQRMLSQYFNIAAFVQPAPGAFGNAARNVLRQPGINNWDLSFFKDFEFPWFGKHHGWAAGETAKLEFRGELFNAFNHVQYNAMNTNFLVTNPTNNIDPITTKPYVSQDPAFGALTSDRGPREIQLALKLIW